MITPWTIYWITRLNQIREFLKASTLISLLIFFTAGIIAFIQLTEYIEHDDPCDMRRKVVKILRLTGAVLAVSALLYTLTPSSREMAAIYVIPKIANSENVRNIGDEMYGLAMEWLKELKAKREGDRQ